MNQFEWTLSARVNCKDDDTSQGVQASTNNHPPCSDPCAFNDSVSDDNQSDVNGYFCVTAPVDDHPNVQGPGNPHYVCDYTHTVIVDLRYSFQPNISVPICEEKCSVSSVCYLNDIADKVRDIVIEQLSLHDQNKYRYVHVFVKTVLN